MPKSRITTSEKTFLPIIEKSLLIVAAVFFVAYVVMHTAGFLSGKLNVHSANRTNYVISFVISNVFSAAPLFLLFVYLLKFRLITDVKILFCAIFAIFSMPCISSLTSEIIRYLKYTALFDENPTFYKDILWLILIYLPVIALSFAAATRSLKSPDKWLVVVTLSVKFASEVYIAATEINAHPTATILNIAEGFLTAFHLLLYVALIMVTFTQHPENNKK